MMPSSDSIYTGADLWLKEEPPPPFFIMHRTIGIGSRTRYARQDSKPLEKP